jgi:hypothetical protein
MTESLFARAALRGATLLLFRTETKIGELLSKWRVRMHEVENVTTCKERFMAPDSLTPNPADGQPTGGETLPAADFISRIEQEMTRIEQESHSLKQQAAQKDQQLAEMRVRLATLAGTKSQTVKPPQIGQTIAGKGVYIGQWQPKDRSGNSLGKRFNVFAAPEDLTDESGKKALLTFKDTAERMMALGNWHGHDGGDFANDTAVYTALKNGSYNGEWFIPTRDLLSDNLYSNKDQGDLKGSFATSGSGLDVWYWSCTERRDLQLGVWHVRFSDGNDGWLNRANGRLSCRPCRVEALTI